MISPFNPSPEEVAKREAAAAERRSVYGNLEPITGMRPQNAPAQPLQRELEIIRRRLGDRAYFKQAMDIDGWALLVAEAKQLAKQLTAARADLAEFEAQEVPPNGQV